MSGRLTILVAGDFSWPIYEPDFCGGLRENGVLVHEFRAAKCFPGVLGRAQAKYVVGPSVLHANWQLIRRVREARPDFVLAWRTPWLHPMTIRACQRLGARLVLYNNDDPFGPDRGLRIWQRYRKAIPYADACFAYRRVNLQEYTQAGARAVGTLRSWFNPRVHRPLDLTEAERRELGADAVFIGHWEPDGRDVALEALMDAGLSVRIHGAGWDEPLSRRRKLRAVAPIRPVFGERYVKALCAAKVGLVFLSARNRDQYTRRCFEIPATGTFMLAPRTEELVGLFEPETQAGYFSGTTELVMKAVAYCADDVRRSTMAAAGRRRCLSDGHDVVSRAKQFVADLQQMFPRMVDG